MPVILLLLGLLSRDDDPLGICDNDVVASLVVGLRVDAHWLVFAHEQRRRSHCEGTEGLFPRAEVMPMSGECQARLSAKAAARISISMQWMNVSRQIAFGTYIGHFRLLAWKLFRREQSERYSCS